MERVQSQSMRSLLLHHGPDILLRDPLEDAGRPMVEDLSSLKLSSDTTLPLQEIWATKQRQRRPAGGMAI
jgi:hypothetical protein